LLNPSFDTFDRSVPEVGHASYYQSAALLDWTIFGDKSVRPNRYSEFEIHHHIHIVKFQCRACLNFCHRHYIVCKLLDRSWPVPKAFWCPAELAGMVGEPRVQRRGKRSRPKVKMQQKFL